MSTNQTWFVNINETTFGPLSQSELESLVLSGVVSEVSMISVDGTTWRRLGEAFPNHNPGISAHSSVAAVTVPPPPPEEQWHVHSHDGKRYGPVPKSELLSWVADGSITADCLVWQEGTPNWQRAGAIFPNLSAAVSVQPSQVSADPAPVQVAKTKRRKEEEDDTNPAVVAVLVLIYVVFGAGFLVFLYYLPQIRRTFGPYILAGLLLLMFIQWITSQSRRRS